MIECETYQCKNQSLDTEVHCDAFECSNYECIDSSQPKCNEFQCSDYKCLDPSHSKCKEFECLKYANSSDGNVIECEEHSCKDKSLNTENDCNAFECSSYKCINSSQEQCKEFKCDKYAIVLWEPYCNHDLINLSIIEFNCIICFFSATLEMPRQWKRR